MIRFAKAFDPSSCAAALPGPEDRDAALAQRVGDAGDEGRLGTDHHQVDRRARSRRS